MQWKTRITELLGCRYPILQGAYAGFGNGEFAAAVADTGAHGMITASTCGTPEKLRDDIKKCRDATDGTFSVNFTLSQALPWSEMLEVCIEERVPVETAAFKPDDLAPRIKEAGLPWIHKAARVKDAVRAARLGANGVIIVGLEGTGFKSQEQLPLMLSLAWTLEAVDIPVIAAGGIGNARGLLGALGMGAEGIMMGTAFMATQECSLNQKMKDAVIQADFDNAELRHRVLAVADPKEIEEVMKLRGTVPDNEWMMMLELVNVKDPNWRNPGSAGKGADPMLRMVSLAAPFIEKSLPVKEFVEGMVGEAEEIASKRQFLSE